MACLADGPVADYQLALAAPDGDHGVDGLDAGLYRGVYRLAGGDVRRHDFDRPRLGGLHWALAVEGAAQRVHHAAYQRVAHGHLHDAAGAANFAALFDRERVAHDDDADAVLFQVEREADDAALELHELVVGYAGQAVHARDAVADLDYGTHVHHGELRAELLDLALDNGCYVLSPGRHTGLPVRVALKSL